MQSPTIAHSTGLTLPTSGQPLLVVRLAQSPDEAQLFQSVGSVVDDLYPNGREKLMAKLLLNTALRDNSFVVALDGEIVAYAAETPKANQRLKLSTFWVREDMRRRGIGRRLIELMVPRWREAGLAECYVTVRLGREQELLALLSKYGFSFGEVVPNLYGPGRDEVVLKWTPISQVDSRRGTPDALIA